MARADVEMRNDEEEEPLETELPRARLNPKNPSRREKREQILNMLSTEVGVLTACVEGPGVGGEHGIEQLDEEKDDSHRCF